MTSYTILLESVIKFVGRDKSHLKPLPKPGRKIIKSMKYNSRVSQRVYASVYSNMEEQLKIYLNSLPPDEIDKVENYFKIERFF